MSKIHFGIIEDRTSDPLMLGRCKVRVFGVHTPNKSELPTEDLPWAMVMMPVTSGSIDFIGQSPTGLIEGSAVAVFFADVDQQIPIIMGSLYGLPLDAADPLLQNDLSTGNTTKWVAPKPAAEDQWQNNSKDDTLKDANGQPAKTTFIDSMVCSEAGYNLIKQYEGLSSSKAGTNSIFSNASKLPPETKIYAYKDSVGIWTIGWGSTFLKGELAVNADTVITKQTADDLLVNKVSDKFAPLIRKYCQVPVTQGMFDALCSLAYNLGFGDPNPLHGNTRGLMYRDVWKYLQNGNYESAAESILTLTAGGSGIIKRRQGEKSMFLSDGIPEKVNSNGGQ